MSIDSKLVSKLAQEFIDAETLSRPLEPITSQYQGITETDAYNIQDAVVALKKEAGEKLIGKKVGATSQPIQQFLGLAEPIYGRLFAGQQVMNGATLSISNFIHPRIECEIAFRLSQALVGPGVTEEDVLKATQAIMPALEINDPRTRDWKIGMAEVIADNGVSARFILGRETSPENIDLSKVSVVLKRNGEEVARATGSAVLGHPARAVAWLANKLAERNEQLEAREVLLPGSLTPLFPVEAGDRIEAEFEKLGVVAVNFS